jgi:Carboxypeptidase regulatory-like domain
MKKKTTVFAALFLALLLNTGCAFAQATGTILGEVKDISGSVISGATVTITEQNTAISRSLKTDESGRYAANLMPVGQYTIQVDFPRFQEAVEKNITLEVQGTREVDFNLTPATLTQGITVTATPVEVQSTNPSLGQVIHAQQVADLPLNGRDFVQLALLAPGTSQGVQPFDFFGGGIGSGSEVSIRGSYSLSSGGSRENRTDWLFDGVDNNELTAGGIAVLPSIDALQEFKVLTFDYSARYGTRAGPTVILISKSGSNQFHGSLFEFLRNTVLNARNFFSPSNPKYNQNQFGGSIGGPIQRDKTFFFFDYQGTRIRQGLPAVAQLPTLLEREGNFTESFPGAPATAIYDPASTAINPVTGQLTRAAFAGNIIPPQQLNPVAVRLLSLFPLPNVAGVLSGNFVGVPNRSLDDNEFDFRLDHTFSQNDRAFARFSRDQAAEFMPSGLPDFGSTPGGYGSVQNLSDHGRNLALSETHIFSASGVNQLTLGYNRIFNHIRSFGDGTDWSNIFGIPGANTGSYLNSGLVNIQFSTGFWGLGDRGFSPFQGGTNVYQISDDFEWVHGAHTVSIGGGIRIMQMNVLGAAFPMGEFSFDNLFTAGFANGSLDASTGNPIASFLLGLPAGGEHDQTFFGTTTGRRWKEFRPYFEDTWRVSSSLTVNLGLAYNLTTPITEQHNRQSNFDFSTGQVLVAGVNTNAAAGVQFYKLGLEPRVGFAWSPGTDRKTAVRGGYAILHDAGWNLGARGLWQNPPFYGSYLFQSDDITPVTTLSAGFPLQAPPSTTNPTGSVYYESPDFRPGIIQQFNFDVQRQLPGNVVFTVGYAGTRSTHLQTLNWNLDTATPGPGIDPPERRPFPNLTYINGILSRGQGRYDSLQVKAEKQTSHGLYFLLGYTYSKAFDNGLYDDLGSILGVPYFPVLTPHNADKGLANIDQTHNFTASVLYQLPFGKGRRFGGNARGLRQQLIGGWQLNLISHIASGFPLGLSTSSNNSGTAIGNRPDRICNGMLRNATVNEFFDVACFVDPAPGQLGNSSRTPLFGPDFVNFDTSLFKSFPLGFREGARLEFRTEVFNIFNHPQFANPGTTLDAAGFGQITSTVNNPRLIQFALKLLF